MKDKRRVYIIGAGAIGMPLATFLAAEGASVVAVRTSRDDIAPTTIEPVVELPEGGVATCRVATASLAQLTDFEDGIVVLTAKATANARLAAKLKGACAHMSLVVMQNGINVEQPFLNAGFTDVYRCVLYATGLPTDALRYRFREVAPSPVGAVSGEVSKLRSIIESLTTPAFRFREEPQIEREAWRKTIINAAFNSVCPLLDVDNGVFHRDPSVLEIARTVITEASAVASRQGIDLQVDDLVDQLLTISRRADGQLISTLQDINKGRETEIEFINVEIARIASTFTPPVEAPVTRMLGEMILSKSRISRGIADPTLRRG